MLTTRQHRILAALVAPLIVAGAPAASALQETRGCLMFGDDGRQLAEMVVQRASQDVLGGAMGSNSREVTVVIRLRSLPDLADAAVEYRFTFVLNKKRLFLTAPANPAVPPTYGVAGPAGTRTILGHPHVTRDAKTNEIRLTAPLAGFASAVAVGPGTTATELAAEALVGIVPVDLAAARTRPYVLGARSCVPVGR